MLLAPYDAIFFKEPWLTVAGERARTVSPQWLVTAG